MESSLGWLEQHVSDVPSTDEWLSASERDTLARLRIPKRRGEWRLGRWTAKRSILLAGARWFRALGLPKDNGTRAGWCRVEVTPAPDGAPEGFFDGRPLPLRISLTHRAGHAACIVGPAESTAGCDLELIEDRDERFVADYFTANERALITGMGTNGTRALVANVIWSAKESALKALRVGLRVDTREVEVRLLPWLARGEWSALAVYQSARPRLLSGWWRSAGERVATVVAYPPQDPPVRLA
jgi:4'-phosphopantetheinyl transferase